MCVHVVGRTSGLATDFDAIEESRAFESGWIQAGTIKKGSAGKGNTWDCEKSQRSLAWWLLQ
jgi:hypothetical protein